MPEFQDSATTRIAAKPDEVFKLITDIDRLPEWNAVIEKVVSKPPTLMPGAEWVVTLHVPGMPRWDSRSQVVEFDRIGIVHIHVFHDSWCPLVAEKGRPA